MSDCSVGNYSVSCEGGCGLVCTSTHCYGWCEPVYLGELDVEGPVRLEPTVIEVRQDGGTEAKPRLQGGDSVKLCAQGLSRDGLVAGLRSILGVELEPSREDWEEEDELPFSGTVDELLDRLGLRRRGGEYAAS